MTLLEDSFNYYDRIQKREIRAFYKTYERNHQKVWLIVIIISDISEKNSTLSTTQDPTLYLVSFFMYHANSAAYHLSWPIRKVCFGVGVEIPLGAKENVFDVLRDRVYVE